MEGVQALPFLSVSGVSQTTMKLQPSVDDRT